MTIIEKVEFVYSLTDIVLTVGKHTGRCFTTWQMRDYPPGLLQCKEQLRQIICWLTHTLRLPLFVLCTGSMLTSRTPVTLDIVNI